MTQVETYYAGRNCVSGLLWEGICKADSWLLGGYLLGETPEIRYMAQRHHIHLTFLPSQHLCLTISDSAALRAIRHFCSGLTKPFARETWGHARTHTTQQHTTPHQIQVLVHDPRSQNCLLSQDNTCMWAKFPREEDESLATAAIISLVMFQALAVLLC